MTLSNMEKLWLEMILYLLQLKSIVVFCIAGSVLVNFRIAGGVNDVANAVGDIVDHVSMDDLTFEFNGEVFTADASLLVDGEQRGNLDSEV